MDALYARQSVDKKDSISIETQLEFARKESKDGDFIEYMDKGYSGKNTKRPAFTKMIADAENGLIHRIIVYKIDRFSRSLLDFANIWEMLAKNGVEFVSVNEKFDTSTPIGKAMLFILMVFAQLERETISERVTDNYYQRAKTGRWTGGPAPYGFENGRLYGDTKERGIPTLKINENMKVVIENFTKYGRGLTESLGELSKELNERGIEGVKRRTWNNVTLSRMLRNPVYVKADADIYAYYKNKGVTITNKLEEFTGQYACMLLGKRCASTRQRKPVSDTTLVIANWEGQVSAAIWLACQKRLDLNKQIGNKGKGKHSWLSGMLKCGYCNRTIRILPDGKDSGRRYMVCTGHIDHNCTHIPKIEIDLIENCIASELTDLLINCMNNPMEETAPINNKDKIELAMIDEKIENLIKCLSTGEAAKITMQYINEEIGSLTNRKKEIVCKISEQGRSVYIEKIDFSSLSIEGKKAVAKSFLNEIIIKDDTINIVWKI